MGKTKNKELANCELVAHVVNLILIAKREKNPSRISILINKNINTPAEETPKAQVSQFHGQV